MTGPCGSEGMVWGEEEVVAKDVSSLATLNGTVFIMVSIYWARIMC